MNKKSKETLDQIIRLMEHKAEEVRDACEKGDTGLIRFSLSEVSRMIELANSFMDAIKTGTEGKSSGRKKNGPKRPKKALKKETDSDLWSDSALSSED